MSGVELEMKNKPLMIALDFSNMEQVKNFLKPFHEPLFVKVGMELFYQTGATLLYTLKEQGHHIFLDLKIHDIPNTVKGAMKGLATFGVDIVNVHAAGGQRMMEASLEGLDLGTNAGEKRARCIAVTQLTSTSEQMIQEELLLRGSLDEVVLSYASLAKKSGLDGVVCSVHEVQAIHSQVDEKFLTVTPGIRVANVAVHDQIRVATPELAREFGADAIVVGRAITQSENPVEMYGQLVKKWRG